MMDFAQWMLPFVTKTDLTKAALKANISHEMQNRFLKLMLDEHSKVGAREQLKKLWTEWVKYNYDEEEQPTSCQAIQGVGLVATPPGTPGTPTEEEERAQGAAAAAAASAEGGPS
jgi:hypothetical protein